MVKELRNYQVDANQAGWDALDEGKDRFLIVMATGLGKTVTAAFFTHDYIKKNGGRVLFLAHTVDILRQARDEFRAKLDPKVSVGITTSLESNNPDADVRFVTFQSMANELADTDPREYSLIIVDEAHHGGAATYRSVIDYFQPRCMFGMTATPDRNDGFDIRDLFGEPVYSYDLADALADDEWLARLNYRLLTDNVDNKKLQALADKVNAGERSISRSQLDKVFILEEKLEEMARIVNEYGQGEKKTIIFCRSVDHMRVVGQFFSDADLYYGELSRKRRLDTLARFRSGDLRKILVVDMFNEGIDIPDAELVAFLRATDSKTVWLQQMGRGLRRTSDKNVLTVLDFVANVDRINMVQELYQAVAGKSGKKKLGVELIRGMSVTYSDEVVSIRQALEYLRAKAYETYEEAQLVAMNADPPFTGSRDFGKRRLLIDPRLCVRPDKTYKDKGWTNWYEFFGHRVQIKKKYTYVEARDAVQNLDPIPTTSPEYDVLYSQNPSLPSAPDKVYRKSGWIDWFHFLGTNKYSYQEAKEMVQQLSPVPTTSPEYQLVYRQYLRLPGSPDGYYEGKGWVDWFDFLGKNRRKYYRTYQEAKEAVQRLSSIPSSGPKYQLLYKQDSLLPGSPDEHYQGKGWIDWYDFLGKPRPKKKK